MTYWKYSKSYKSKDYDKPKHDDTPDPIKSDLCDCFKDLYGIDVVFGTEGNDRLEGQGLINKLLGYGGNDTLVDRGLFAKLDGGDGNDWASYEKACFAVNVDLNKTGWQWTGGGFFDKLEGIENLLGSKYNDTLIGNEVNNRLNGGLGADKMVGGLGNDIYSVDNVGDKVVEKAGEGTDLVLSTINYTLGANVENLALFGDAVFGTGNELRNLIAGNAKDNVINGKGGNDTLLGGAGADLFVFDQLDGSFDDINDFVSGVDKLGFDGDVFGLPEGPLDPDYVVISATGGVNKDGSHNLATTSDHGQFIVDRYYNVYWDADGAGAGNAVLIVGASAPVAADDLVIV